MTKHRYINCELEELRNSIPPHQNDKKILNEILEKSNNIHAGFLFYAVGEKLLQKLCRCLCATRDSLNYSGWKELGNEIGLDSLLLQSLKNCYINNQDHVYNMILAYIQKNEATIDKIYTALHNINRPDIIIETNDLILKLCENIHETSVIYCEKGIIKPPAIPTPPHILKNLEISKISDNKENKPKIKDVLCKSGDGNKQPTKKYNKIIMLTCHSANVEIAQKIAQEMRKKEKEHKIGVVLLEEHIQKVIADSETFISNCFAQADYIVPVLTLDYLNVISGLYEPSSVISGVDSAFLKYIHLLMLADFSRNGYRNFKIRCVIPDEDFITVQQHPACTNPEFRIWIQMSQIQYFKNNILFV